MALRRDLHSAPIFRLSPDSDERRHAERYGAAAAIESRREDIPPAQMLRSVS